MTESSEQEAQVNAQIIKIGQRHILYDAALIEHPDEALFLHASGLVQSLDQKTAVGRGEAIFFTYQGQRLVLKHYHRGGMVARLMGDLYFGYRLESVRAFREWRLLARLQSLGLPAPVPIAAGVTRHGIYYRADLITREIPGVTPLAELLMKSEMAASSWRAIGSCIRRFHDEDVYHADLNTRNILLDDSGNVFLVDFDKCYVRAFGNSWKAANLSRLQRSLLKFKANHDEFHSSSKNWSDLLSGYK